MSECLDDRTLWLLLEGEENAPGAEHLRSCLRCASRAQRLRDELAAISAVLREDPPAALSRERAPGIAARLAVAAVLGGLLVVAGLEALIWRAAHSLVAESIDDASTDAFLEQVSEALSGIEDTPESENGRASAR